MCFLTLRNDFATERAIQALTEQNPKTPKEPDKKQATRIRRNENKTASLSENTKSSPPPDRRRAVRTSSLSARACGFVSLVEQRWYQTLTSNPRRCQRKRSVRVTINAQHPTCIQNVKLRNIYIPNHTFSCTFPFRNPLHNNTYHYAHARGKGEGCLVVATRKTKPLDSTLNFRLHQRASHICTTLPKGYNTHDALIYRKTVPPRP